MKSIVIGVDDSARSEDAVAFGAWLAGASGARVVLACSFPYSDAPSRSSNIVYREALEEEAEATVRRMRGLLDLPDERVGTVISANLSPAHALHDAAELEHAALVVVGHTHHGHAGRIVRGATAERLLHGAPCAVAVVPDGYRDRAPAEPRRIGVAFVETPESRAALSAAVAVARALHTRLEVISAVAYDPGYGRRGLAPQVVHEQIVEQVRAELRGVVHALPGEPDAQAVLLDGDPATQLIAHSAKLDLLLMGSRGYGPLRAVLAGGVSGRVSRDAHCPVIVTPRGVDAPLDELFGVRAPITA
jgi:nucleotide-binding universal stress UspA family protein